MRTERELLAYLEWLRTAKLEALRVGKGLDDVAAYSALIWGLEWVLEYPKHGNAAHYRKGCNVKVVKEEV